MSWVAAAVVGGTVIGGVISSSGAKSAANTEAAAATNASNNTLAAQQQMRTDLQPYSSLGSGSINALLKSMGYTGTYDSSGNLTGLTQNSNNPLNAQYSNPAFSYAAWDPSKLDQTPGYQFTLQQGMKGVTNSNVARGLGLSGAQLKGISDYTTGNADNTYNQQYQNYTQGFNNALAGYNANTANNQNTFTTNYNTASQNVNRLAGLVQTGQNSAAQVGTSGLAAASASGNQLTAGANAGAAATVAGTNALTGSVSTAGQNALLTSLLKNNNTASTSGSIYGTSPTYQGTSASGFDTPSNYG